MTFRPQKKPALTLDASLVQDDMPLEVIPKVFIGSIHAAFNSESLHHNGITHILNASRLPITFPKLFNYLSVEIRDRDSSNILACIPTTNIFIEAGLEHGGVLVHCFGGKSRSAAFVCAYIMSSLGWSFDDAYSTVKAARSIVDINAGFECQLRAYHAAGCDVYVAQQLLLRTRVRALYKQRGLGMLGTSESKQGRSSPHSAEKQPSNRSLHSTDAKDSPHSDTGGSEHSMDIVTNGGDSTTGSTPTLQLPTLSLGGARSGPPSLTIGTDSTQSLHTYDSFTFGAITAITNKNNEHKSGPSLSKLATQVEDEPEFTFSKTRSISDVYEGGSDPMEEGNNDLHAHEEDDPSALLILERKLHYIADSPSNATGLGGLAGFGALSTSTPIAVNQGTMAPLGLSIGIGAGLGMGLSIGTGPMLMTVTERSTSGDSFNGTSSSYAEFAAGLGSTALSSSAGFMQGSGSSSGNRTHRASAGNNRGGKGGSNSKGRKGRHSAEVDPGHPACRLSRPGSTVVRVIPPLRGLERQFRCSWCNTALFTTANVLRTDVDFRPLLDAFTASSAAVLGSISTVGGAGANANSRSTQQGGGEDEYLAQEKHRFSSSSAYQQNQQSGSATGENINGSGTGTPLLHLHASPHTSSHPHGAHSDFKQDSHLTYEQPSHPVTLARTLSGTGAKDEGSPPPTTLPRLQQPGAGQSAEKGASISPLSARRSEAKPSLSRCASKEDVYAHDSASALGNSPNQTSGRFPPIMLNRSQPGSQQNLTRGTSASGAGLMLPRNPSGSNINRDDKAGDEMDVDSPPKYGTSDHGPSFSMSGNGHQGHGAAPSYNNSRYDEDHDHEGFAAPKVPPGGMKTSRAGLAKAFDFDLPLDEPAPESATTTNGTLTSVSEGAINYDGEGSRRNSHTQAQDDSSVYGVSGKSNGTGSGKSNNNGGDNSRRNSLGFALPTLLHSKTSPSTIGGQNMQTTPRTAELAQYAAQSAAQSAAHSASVPTLLVTPGQTAHTSPRGLDNPANHRNNLKVATNMSLGIAAINTSPSVHPAGSNTSTATSMMHMSPHSTVSSARSEESPSPRIHIPPHRLQQQMGLLNTNFDGISPRSQHLYQQYPRPQSAEKRRWLDRMNLLRQGGPGASNVRDLSATAGLGDAMQSENLGIASAGYLQSGDHKVARMAEADDAASLLVYGGAEKYFHIEYMEWMGPAPFQAGVDTGDICCSSCKNTLGTWMWNPSTRMTLGNKLEAPLFRLHKHVVHQVDVQFDATPSSTPRMDDGMHTDNA